MDHHAYRAPVVGSQNVADGGSEKVSTTVTQTWGPVWVWNIMVVSGKTVLLRDCASFSPIVM